MAVKTNCKYCGKPIDPRGLASHLHFKHLSYILAEFRLNPSVWVYMWALGWGEPPTLPLALPQPRDGFGPSRLERVLPMLASYEKARRWV